MSLDKWEPCTINHHPTKFDVYLFCGGGDIAFLFCHVTSSDHMIKGTYDLVGGSSTTLVTTMVSSILIGIVELEICDLVSGSMGHQISLRIKGM